VDAADVYLADTYTCASEDPPDGIITTVAGSRTCANPDDVAACYGGDGGSAVGGC